MSVELLKPGKCETRRGLFRWEVGCEVIWWNLVEEVVNELGSEKLDSGEYLNLDEFLE